MISCASDDYLSARDWLRAVAGGKDMILRHTSALEFLELFAGYMHGNDIDVYAKRHDEYENIRYCIVDTFDGIEYFCYDNVLCTSVNQTFNDMLSDFDSIDEQSLIEGLSKYYYTHGKSFNGLMIKQENMKCFNSIKDWAIEYYDEG